MNQPVVLSKYDLHQTYQWNYDHPPEPVDVELCDIPGQWSFCGLDVDSPLGMPAGPLLNGAWILYYASLGLDVLTYKTVRSSQRDCYPLPNLVPVETAQLQGGETFLPAADVMTGSWAVSFGMPSTHPDVWRADVEWTRSQLPTGKLLSVSVVGTTQEGSSIDDLADDYALCARWAVESGADVVETNFSCPNVSTQDGQIYCDMASANNVAQRVRAAIGRTPYAIKIGHVTEETNVEALLDAVGPFVDGIAMTNSVAATVRTADGQELFDGARRGICGAATRTASLEQTRHFAAKVAERNLAIGLIGVGGVGSADDVTAQLDAGAESVHIATAAMLDPLVACKVRQEFAAAQEKHR